MELSVHGLCLLFMAIACMVLINAVEGSGVLLADGFITWDDLEVQTLTGKSVGNSRRSARSNRVITVSKDGSADSKTVQGAVDMVPHGNSQRVKIFISPGLYREKVLVPSSKPYISFIRNGNSNTTIAWHLRASDRDSSGQSIGTLDSASVSIEADYFCANGITFENTAPPALPGASGMQAVALRIAGDKSVIYNCRILGTQDTLFDQTGRHYISQSFIQGSIDFIFGSARSLYQGCTLNAVASSYGAVAASQRESPTDNSGFSFVNCSLHGTGMLYLGRAWGRFARVVYSYCQFDNIIIPQGWNDWDDPSRQRTAWFGEYMCSGKGSNLSNRVQWARSLNYDEARPFIDRNYIDGNQWLRL